MSFSLILLWDTALCSGSIAKNVGNRRFTAVNRLINGRNPEQWRWKKADTRLNCAVDHRVLVTHNHRSAGRFESGFNFTLKLISSTERGTINVSAVMMWCSWVLFESVNTHMAWGGIKHWGVPVIYLTGCVSAEGAVLMLGDDRGGWI